jgi:hypothetical protein
VAPAPTPRTVFQFIASPGVGLGDLLRAPPPAVAVLAFSSSAARFEIPICISVSLFLTTGLVIVSGFWILILAISKNAIFESRLAFLRGLSASVIPGAEEMGRGTGPSKQEAEIAAAENSLKENKF